MTKAVTIANRIIGPGHPTYIIAEVGINHNGDVALAKRLIDVAVEAGADAVKFQKRTTRDILIRAGLERPYESENAFAPTYGEHRDRLELSHEAYRDLFQYAAVKGIHFLASVWDPKSADFIDALGAPAFKISSADLTNLPLLRHVAQKGKPMIVSTGMSTMNDVTEAVDTIRQNGNPPLILLHCVSTYPCENSDVNLRVMQQLRDTFGVPVGYSGHDRGVVIPAAAVAMGACVVEKHITLDRSMKGSDHSASLEPDGLKRVVRYIRNVEAALGDGVKRVLEAEIPIRKKLAKSIATVRAIPEGTVITANMLTVKGPGEGLAPRFLPNVIGRRAAISLAEDVLLPTEAMHWPTV